MDGIERSNRLTWKSLPCAVDNLGTNTQDVPVRRRRRQVRPSICSLSFRELTKRGGTQKDPVALNKSEIRCDDEIARCQQPTNGRT